MLIKSTRKDDYSPAERAFVIILAVILAAWGLCGIIGQLINN